MLIVRICKGLSGQENWDSLHNAEPTMAVVQVYPDISEDPYRLLVFQDKQKK